MSNINSEQGLFEAMFEHHPMQMIAVDRSGKIIAINKAKKESGDRIPTLGDVMYRDYAAKHNHDMYNELMRCIDDQQSREFTDCLYNDRILWISIAPFSSGAVIVSEDLTERRQMADTLRESEARLRAITDAAQDAIIMIDHRGRISFWNPAAERILGFSQQDAMGQSLHYFIAPQEYHDRYHKAFARFQQTGAGAAIGCTIDLQARCKSERIIDIQLSLSSISIAGQWHAIGILRDVTEQKMAEKALRESQEQLRLLSITDSLTGLYNRRHCMVEIKREIANAERYRQSVSLIMFDVDDFKRFNDVYGHDRGDAVLKIIGRTVKKSIRKNDIACRIGGEEFLIILPMAHVIIARDIASRISKSLQSEYLAFADDAVITISAGVAQYDINEDVDAFVRRADQLMMRAKQQGKNRITV